MITTTIIPENSPRAVLVRTQQTLSIVRGVLRRLVLRLFLVGLFLLATIPFTAYGQYSPLPVPEKFRGPSGEAGQILLEGFVHRIELFHGRIDDELDWHVYINLPADVRQALHSNLWSRGYTFMSSPECLSDPNCELSDIYSEIMVIDRRTDQVPVIPGDVLFYSADFTSALLLTQPTSPPPNSILSDALFNACRGLFEEDHTGEHPAFDLGLIAICHKGSGKNLSDFSQLVRDPAHRVLLQGAFVEDADHRTCGPIPAGLFKNCAHAPLQYVKKTYPELHPLDSIAFAMNEDGTINSAKFGEGDWPATVVKWRVATFANSNYHRINKESYLKKERTTTWYLELPKEAYNSWGPNHINIRIDEQPLQLFDSKTNSMYTERRVESYPRAQIAVDPKDGRRKLKVSVTMKKPGEIFGPGLVFPDKGGIVVRDYLVRVQLHSSPDLCIRNSGSTFGDCQSAPWATTERWVQRDQTAVYFVRGKNQGPVPMQFQFYGLPGTTNWTVKYFDAAKGGNDITAQVTSDGWLSPEIPGGGTTSELRVEVTPNRRVASGVKREIVVFATSSVEPGKIDFVKAVTRVGNPPRPVQ